MAPRSAGIPFSIRGPVRHCSFILAVGALLFALSAECLGAARIRVAIADSSTQVVLQSPAGLTIGRGRTAKVRRTITLTPADLGTDPILVRSRGSSISVNGKKYRGTMEVRRNGIGRIRVINDLDLEDYLKGVVAAEIPHEWEMEALKAQAVASRTYALHQKEASGGRSYHLLATVDSQMYVGMEGERPRAVRAVDDTRGEVLQYEGRLISAYYHSSCGGHTEDALELWGIDASYLRGVDCDCQRISTYGPWERKFSIPEVIGALRREGYPITDIAAVENGDITPAGRVKRVLFRSSQGMISIPAESLRSILGYSRFLSVFIEPELVDREIVISGRGRGHGVGLCQWGAQDLALQGKEYRAILEHYYPGTKIVRR